MNRPQSVTIVSWIIIAYAVEAMWGSASGLSQVLLRPMLPENYPISMLALSIGAVVFSLLQIIFAAYMLKGESWSRVAYITCAAIIALSTLLVNSPLSFPIKIFSILRVIVFAFFLFRPDSNEYFSKNQPSAITDA